MKRLLIAVILLVAFCASALASDVILNWTVPSAPANQTPTSVRAYEKTGADPSVYTKVGETAVIAGPLTIGNVTVGLHTYTVRAVNAAGESPNSNEASATVTIIVIPMPLTNLTITVVVK